MGNFDDRVIAGLDQVTGPLYGQALLESLKAAMVEQKVFKSLFGDEGERIFIDKLPSYNDKIFPLVEFWWTQERYQSRNTRMPGNINGRILFPVQLQALNPNFNRRVASAFMRFMGSDAHDLFDQVPGLIEIGVDMDAKYDQLAVSGALNIPAIMLTIPVLFDLRLLQRQTESTDYAGNLDADGIGLVETYKIKFSDENQNVLIPEGVLSETGQDN